MKKLLIFLLIFCCSQSFAATIIDHTCADRTQIPPNWIDSVQANVKMYYVHTSHGNQMTCGLEIIEGADAAFDAEVGTDELPSEAGAFCIHNTLGDPDDYWFGAGITETRSIHDGNGDLNVSFYCWCNELNFEDSSYVEDYLDSISTLETEYPSVTFIYATCMAQKNGIEGYTRYLANEQIRNYCTANNKVLFDFGDLDSWWYDAEVDTWGFKTYEYNEQDIPWQNFEWAGSNCGHVNWASCEQKAEALWWMAAVLAGWDESSSKYYVKTTGNDSYSGESVDSAWLTITKACTANAITPNDTIMVMAGTYDVSGYENLNFEDDSVTMKAYPGAVVWVTGRTSAGSSQRSIFRIQNRSGIVFDSINMKYGASTGIEFQYSDRCVLKNAIVCSVYAGWGPPYTTANIVEINDCDTVEVTNCELFVTGMDGTLPTNHNNVGIVIYGMRNSLTDTVGWGHVISYNTIHDVVTGIYMKIAGWPGFYCHHNTVYDFHWTGIMISTDSAQVHHNLVYAGDSVGMYGIRWGERQISGGWMHSRYGKCFNNTVSGCDYGLYRVTYMKDSYHVDSNYTVDTLEVWNNIFVNAPLPANNDEFCVFEFWASAPDSFYSDYNCIWDSLNNEIIHWTNSGEYTLTEYRNATANADHSITQNPLFTNPAAGNYTLQVGSPCRTSGRGGSYENYMGAFDPGDSLSQTTVCVDTTDSTFSVRDSITTLYSVACDRAVLWVDVSTPLTAADSVAVFADDNVDTLVAAGLDASTKYYYRCVAWDDYHADTTDLDSTITKGAVEEEVTIKILGKGYFRGGKY